MIKVRYLNLCGVCQKDLTAEEIEKKFCFFQKKKIGEYEKDKIVNEFLTFFKKIVGEPKKIQRFWAQRFFGKENFSLIAPTGIGKTTFGEILSLFLAKKGKKSYLIFPTSLLAKEVKKEIHQWAKKEKIKLKILFYGSDFSKKQKEKFFSKIEKGNFDILLTTSQFLVFHHQKLIGKDFALTFVDDVDSILKRSKNIERLLEILGFKKQGNSWNGKPKSQLVVSTATAKKGKKANLLFSLLGLDVGKVSFNLRNIEDIVVYQKKISFLKKTLKKMGKGGFIYTSNIEEAKKILSELKDFKGKICEKDEDLEDFKKGKVDILLGPAAFYGRLVRGIDLPKEVRYAVFWGAPIFKIKIKNLAEVSTSVIRALTFLFSHKKEIRKFLPILNILDFKKKEKKELINLLENFLRKKEKFKFKDVYIDEKYIYFPDIKTYLQASGRTSRFFAGGITKGVSFLMEDRKETLKAFLERAKFYEIEFKKIEESNFSLLKKEVENTRKDYEKNKKFPLKVSLLVVESPTKAKQISRFFGKPAIKTFLSQNKLSLISYEVLAPERLLLVTACLGHLVDLAVEGGFYGVEVNEKIFPIYASIKRCQKCNHQFTDEKNFCPRCGSKNITDSKERIKLLRHLSHDVGEVIIGTDPDAEGEKIAWDLKNLLSGYAEIKRAEFHEITKKAILEALNSLKKVDENLVKAQITRRTEDRWIGFSLSEKLWRIFKEKNLSAGRAQTPVLGWIIERTKEHKKKKTIGFSKELGLSFETEKKQIEVEIKLLEKKKKEFYPLPPYTTDTFLRDANAIFKLSSKKIMGILQDLFENGLITYHRTDSTRVSDRGKAIAKEYLKKDFFGRSWKKEGAHECIRPTRPFDRDTLKRLVQEKILKTEYLSFLHFGLYDLIFRRFMASQAKSFEGEVCIYEIKYDKKVQKEERVVSTQGKAWELFHSFLVLPPLPLGKRKIKLEIRKISQKPLFSESEIIKLMKEKGIGRPSTYATLIERLFLRHYIKEKKGKVFSIKRGEEVFDYLSLRYKNFIDEKRTKEIQEKMDKIEKGEIDFQECLRNLYEEVRKIQKKDEGK